MAFFSVRKNKIILFFALASALVIVFSFAANLSSNKIIDTVYAQAEPDACTTKNGSQATLSTYWSYIDCPAGTYPCGANNQFKCLTDADIGGSGVLSCETCTRGCPSGTTETVCNGQTKCVDNSLPNSPCVGQDPAYNYKYDNCGDCTIKTGCATGYASCNGVCYADGNAGGQGVTAGGACTNSNGFFGNYDNCGNCTQNLSCPPPTSYPNYSNYSDYVLCGGNCVAPSALAGNFCKSTDGSNKVGDYDQCGNCIASRCPTSQDPGYTVNWSICNGVCYADGNAGGQGVTAGGACTNSNGFFGNYDNCGNCTQNLSCPSPDYVQCGTNCVASSDAGTYSNPMDPYTGQQVASSNGNTSGGQGDPCVTSNFTEGTINCGQCIEDSPRVCPANYNLCGSICYTDGNAGGQGVTIGGYCSDNSGKVGTYDKCGICSNTACQDPTPVFCFDKCQASKKGTSCDNGLGTYTDDCGTVCDRVYLQLTEGRNQTSDFKIDSNSTDALWIKNVTGDNATISLLTLLDSNGDKIFKVTGEGAVLANRNTEPSAATAGMLYYDTNSKQVKLYNGTAWGPLGGGGNLLEVLRGGSDPTVADASSFTGDVLIGGKLALGNDNLVLSTGENLISGIIEGSLTGNSNSTSNLILLESLENIGTNQLNVKVFKVGSNYSFSAGWHTANTGATGGYSTALGYSNIAEGDYSFVSGYATTAQSWGSTAMGSYSLASGSSSTALGSNTIASGNASTALGSQSTASGGNSLALGYKSIAGGGNSLAGGSLSQTTTNASNAVALGRNVIAAASSSIVLGEESEAKGNNSVVLGRWLEAGSNINDENIFVFGRGIDNNNRLINNTADSLMIGFNRTTPMLTVTTDKVQIGSGAKDSNGNFTDKLCLNGDGTVDPGECISSWSEVGGAAADFCSSAPQLSSVTSPSDGNLSGYSGANALCDAADPGSHLCTTSEILNSINCGTDINSIISVDAWVSGGIPLPSQTSALNDCFGWTSNSAADLGINWLNDNGTFYTVATTCGSSHVLACCK